MFLYSNILILKIAQVLDKTTNTLHLKPKTYFVIETSAAIPARNLFALLSKRTRTAKT
jgi:hypothetical protein